VSQPTDVTAMELQSEWHEDDGRIPHRFHFFVDGVYAGQAWFSKKKNRWKSSLRIEDKGYPPVRAKQKEDLLDGVFDQLFKAGLVTTEEFENGYRFVVGEPDEWGGVTWRYRKVTAT